VFLPRVTLLPGQRDFSTCNAARFLEAPGDRAVVGNTEKHRAFTFFTM
jgi:hypothetical protein